MFEQVKSLPWVSIIIQYQEVLGLAIRESESSYLKNFFTKFQLMMTLDFAMIAISFLTIEYYEILLGYFKGSVRTTEAKPDEVNNFSNIYHKYISFKLTEWLSNFNELLVSFARGYLWLYYPILGIFCCLFFSYATMLYFSACVIYYLRLNQKHY